ncbi:PH domain-containing protein [Arsukibacterium indicum]|uniref:PH domain-containing protein n=1 Tax=Arsukibacterium indicum TaxID=2848612 RepID=A0ABS6MHV9_9GAMM|nr:PH domain-containing protein [Arsukibacterium indicum]MBV2128398.1 PH domain-containing protein [Arsukibacterium indicum]
MSNAAGFSNNQLAVEQITPLQALQSEALSSRYRLLRQGVNAGFFAGLMLLIMLLWWQPWWPVPADLMQVITHALWLVPLFGVLRAFYCWQADKNKHFALREHDISYSSGIFFRKMITQPVVRIQHIELKQGPLERKASLARLQLFSAGGALHTFEIPGLSLTQAQQIRQFVLQHKDALQDEQQQ